MCYCNILPPRPKIGPSDRLPELIRSHLPGLACGSACTTAPNPVSGRIHLLRHPPRGSIVGTHARYGGITMHTAGEFPGLETELWGVRDK